MDAVDVSQDIIRNGLSISKYTISYKHLEEAINYARQEKYEFVALRMQDVESSLAEILQNEILYNNLNNAQFRRHVSEFRDTMKSVQTNANEIVKLNKEISLFVSFRINNFSSITIKRLKSISQQ